MSLTLTVTQQVNQFNITVSQSGVSVEVNPVVNAEAATATDEKAKVSANDTTAGYLNGKLVAGTGITLTENTDGGNETLSVINDSPSPLTTKGDLYGFSTVDARLPVGTNDQVLTADSTASLGVKWADAASGGGEYQNYELNFDIGKTALGAGYWIGYDAAQVDTGITSYNPRYRGYIGVATSSDLSTVGAAVLKTFTPMGVAKGNQTVDSLVFYGGGPQPYRIKSIGIIKCVWNTNHTAFTSVTTLLEDKSVAIGADGFYTLSAAGFASTAINDKDFLYLFIEMEVTTVRLKPCWYRLKCLIN